MKIRERVLRALDLLLDARALAAWAAWPHFSLTSYRMVSALAAERIAPGTIIDVGANVGQFTVAAARIFGPQVRIHAFEPHPQCVARLRHNLAKLRNVTIYPLAVADRDGDATLHLNANHRASSLLPLAEAHRQSFPSAVEVGTVFARATTLDAVFGDLPLAPPVLLKLDVQGAEAMTLRGGVATLARVQWVVMEASFRSMYQGEAPLLDLIRAMEAMGFHFVRPVGWLCDPRTSAMLQIDALFVRDEAYISPAVADSAPTASVRVS